MHTQSSIQTHTTVAPFVAKVRSIWGDVTALKRCRFLLWCLNTARTRLFMTEPQVDHAMALISLPFQVEGEWPTAEQLVESRLSCTHALLQLYAITLGQDQRKLDTLELMVLALTESKLDPIEFAKVAARSSSELEVLAALARFSR